MNAPSKLTFNKGHGPKNSGVFDPGAVGPTGYKESTQNQEVGDIAIANFRRNGWQVLDIQDGDLWDITNTSNAWKPNYFISLHADSFADPTAHGITTYIQGTGGMAEKIAKEVQRELVLATGLTDRGVKVANLHVNRETIGYPSILIEAGFISNPYEESLMKKPEWDKIAASAICKGFSRAVDVAYSEVVAPAVVAAQPSSDKDIYLSVRVLQSKSDALVKQIQSLGYACKVLPLA